MNAAYPTSGLSHSMMVAIRSWVKLDLNSLLFVPDKPGAPQKLSVTSVSERSVSLKWSEPQYDGGSEITNYIVEEREAVRRSWNRSGTVDANDKKVCLNRETRQLYATFDLTVLEMKYNHKE